MHRVDDVVSSSVDTEGNLVTEEHKTTAVPSTEGESDHEVSATEDNSAKVEVEDKTETETEVEGEKEDKDSDETDKSTKKSGLHKRIDRLNKRHADETAALKAEMETLRAQVPTKKEAEVKVEGPAKPDANEYATHSDYVEALVNWTEAKRQVQAEAKQRDEQVKQEQQTMAERQKSMTLKLDQARELGNEMYDDFDEVLAATKEQPTPEIVQFLLESEIPADLMYYLSKNEEEYNKIRGLSGIAAARALTKLELKLEQTPNGKPASSNAPAPIKPVSASSAVKATGLRDDLDYDEWRKQRMKERSKR